MTVLSIAGIEKPVTIYEKIEDVDAMLIKIGYNTITYRLNVAD